MMTTTFTNRKRMLATDCTVDAIEVRIDGKLILSVDISEDGVTSGNRLTPWSDIFAAAVDGKDELSAIYLHLAREGVRRELTTPPHVAEAFDGDRSSGSVWTELMHGDVAIATGPEFRLGTQAGRDALATSPLRKLATLFGG